ncbi:MAG TPA: hypothetical protein PLH94_00340 [Fimbriimonadaceae bacterium]|nr:hypothetical protein [Fimbriimonadaceae bacterium]
MRLFALCGAVAIVGSANAGVWNLNADWSDSANPNGPWTLMKNPTAPFTTVIPQWSPGFPQPAWADQPVPLHDHVPAWYKRTPIDYFAIDVPNGVIAAHGAEVDRTGTNVTLVRWTSPITGTVKVLGDIWPARHLGREMDWALAVNGSVTSVGQFAATNSYSSANPMNFYEGSGGFGAVSVNVVPGTTIDLRVISVDQNVGDFLATRYCLSTGDPFVLLLDVALEDWVGPIDAEPVTVTILRQDGVVVEERSIVLNSEGPSSMLACLEGEYRVCVKAGHWLRQCDNVMFAPDGSGMISLSLPNGDIDGSNVIDSDDFDILVANFGGTSGPADLDGSGGIDSDDFDILVKNFGLEGD